MRAGQLRDRLTIQRPVKTPGQSWGPQTSYTTLATVWAGVTPKASTEKADPKGVETLNRFEIRTRFIAGITTEHRIEWKGRTLDIVGVTDADNRGRELIIEAAEHPEGA